MVSENNMMKICERSECSSQRKFYSFKYIFREQHKVTSKPIKQKVQNLTEHLGKKGKQKAK